MPLLPLVIIYHQSKQMEAIMNKNERPSVNTVKSLIMKYLEKINCCTIKDIFYFARNNGFELKLEHIRYHLETLEANGVIQRTKIARKNVYYLTKYKKDIYAILGQVEGQVVEMLDKGLLFHTAEITNEIVNHFHIGRGVAYVILRQLAFEGKICYFFGLSYKGKLFRLYFVPKNKDEIEKQVTRIKKYVSNKRLVFPNEKAVGDLIFLDDNAAWKGLKIIHLDVKDFKNILLYLSYLGEINQVYFIQGYPFAIPGHATELRNMLQKSDAPYGG